MKKKVMNIRPQEFTDGGERSVRYKGSDGKMHAMLPQNAAVPVAERTVIEAGTEITLAQAHEIEDFDFNSTPMTMPRVSLLKHCSLSPSRLASSSSSTKTRAMKWCRGTMRMPSC